MQRLGWDGWNEIETYYDWWNISVFARKNSGPNFLQEPAIFTRWITESDNIHMQTGSSREMHAVNTVVFSSCVRVSNPLYVCNGVWSQFIFRSFLGTSTAFFVFFAFVCLVRIGMEFFSWLEFESKSVHSKSMESAFQPQFFLDKLHKLQQKVVRSKCVNQKVLKICHSETKKMLIYKKNL